MKLVPNEKYPGTFEWQKRGQRVADITLYKDGLVEFTGGSIDIAVEGIGRKGMQVVINGLTFVPLPRE